MTILASRPTNYIELVECVNASSNLRKGVQIPKQGCANTAALNIIIFHQYEAKNVMNELALYP
jgi:hypothetical protein